MACARLALTSNSLVASGARPERTAIMLRRLIDKLFFGGYEAADKGSASKVVARFARGNISIQFDRYLTAERLEKLQSDGDKAAARLAGRAKRAGF